MKVGKHSMRNQPAIYIRYGADLLQEVTIQRQLRSKIPKKDGTMRKLGIPTLETESVNK
ncbi:MAG: hypothetical protein IPJ13_32560 [Saprospiraceae bacterium]|nr:hypothetical protein [Saprospiraceae bacterium]